MWQSWHYLFGYVPVNIARVDNSDKFANSVINVWTDYHISSTDKYPNNSV
jgi:hypothetical protein